MRKLLLITATAFVFCFAAHAQESRESMEKKRKSIEEDIQYTNKLLEKTQKSKTSTLREVRLIDNNIKSREKLLENLRREIGLIDNNISVLTRSIRENEALLKKNKRDYENLIKSYHRHHRPYNLFQFLLSSESFHQAYMRIKYYRQYKEYRQNQIERVLALQAKLTEQQNELARQKKDKQMVQESEARERKGLLSEKDRQNRKLKEIQKQERDLKNALAEKQKAANALSAAIRKLIEEQARASQKKVVESPGTKTPGKKHETFYTPEEIKLSNDFASNQGKLPWPVPKGVITEYFGEHPHPVLKGIKVKNNGLTIATDLEREAQSVFNGLVSKVFAIPGINNIVIIRHGEYLTVYSNLKAVKVKEGEKVTTGQQIGTVAESRDKLSGEIHFELWKAKTQMDPGKWLIRK